MFPAMSLKFQLCYKIIPSYRDVLPGYHYLMPSKIHQVQPLPPPQDQVEKELDRSIRFFRYNDKAFLVAILFTRRYYNQIGSYVRVVTLGLTSSCDGPLLPDVDSKRKPPSDC